ncbi:hypothetical protein IV203_022312 [Nitzschia inconspicua]|uniref:DUF6824 domain-containing protein n=1 Tax=Nitzschia inconspicua TaxID=303405 RepID=A0A9K3KJS3_9STRA|nr:hypothetical protein IV203_022312 [Nitzschia inconspicua]
MSSHENVDFRENPASLCRIPDQRPEPHATSAIHGFPSMKQTNRKQVGIPNETVPSKIGQTTELPSCSLPHPPYTPEATTSFHSVQHRNHSSPPMSKSNDFTLSPAIHSSAHTESSHPDKKRQFPNLPTPIEGESSERIASRASTIPALASITAPSSFVQVVDTDSTPVPASKEPNPMTPTNGLAPVPSLSKRDSLPLGLRNKKMQATDCLLFAATLLEEDGDATGSSVCHSSAGIRSRNQLAAVGNESMTVEPVPQSLSFKSTTLLPSHHTSKLDSTSICSADQSFSVASPNLVVSSALRVERGNDDRGSLIASSPVLPPVMDFSPVDEPKVVDVLCGRGGKVNNHPGNIIFRRIVEINKQYYQSVHKRNRILVSQSIVQAITNHGGRFLIMGPRGKQSWVPIDFKKAVQKTSQALRECKKEDDDFEKGAKVVASRQVQLVTTRELAKPS